MDFGTPQTPSGLIVICGPTATGKSGLAVAIAQRLDTVILSADSRQVYRDFDIGTAKPSIADQATVPHHLIDICNPTEVLTLADYQAQAQALITASPPIPLLVGGTGLYIKSIVRGLTIPRVPPHPDLRSHLASLGQSHCYALLQQVDQASANRLHPHDQIRTLRALEVFYVTGRPMSQQQGESPPAYPILQLGLDCATTENLRDRIQHRTTHMIDAGFVDEVIALHQRYGHDLPLLNTLGYAEIGHYLRGDLSLSEAIAQTVIHTRQFAKRQRTWFRADPTIEWFDADAPDLVEQVWIRIQEFLTAIG